MFCMYVHILAVEYLKRYDDIIIMIKLMDLLQHTFIVLSPGSVPRG